MTEKPSQPPADNPVFPFLLRSGLLTLGLAALGLGMGALLNPALRAEMGRVSPAYWLWAFPITLMALALHEGGHLLAGRWVGFRFLLLILGPFRLVRSHRGLRLELNTNLALYGGLAVSQPLDFNQLTRRFATVASGGPFANLALGLFCAALGYGLPYIGSGPLPDFGPGTALPVLLLLLAAFISFSIAIGTLLPAEYGGALSDGALLLALRRSDRTAQLRAYLLMLQAAFLGGDRPRQLDPSLLQRAVACRTGGPMDALARLYAYYFALDSGDLLLAYDHLKEALALFEWQPRNLRAILGLEAAYFIAFHHHDPQASQAWLDRSRGITPQAGTYLRAEAAVLLAGDQRPEALRLAQIALHQAARSPDLGIARAEREWIEAIIARASAPRSWR